MIHLDLVSVKNNLYRHVERLSINIGDRHIWKNDSLDRTAEYIESVLNSANCHVTRQSFIAYEKEVCNLVVKKRGNQEGVIVVGAHYDTVPGSPGADDNASAVAGLLELAKLCSDIETRKTLIFVFFVNEESPCFGTMNMGSMVYAGSLRDKNIPLEFMISLEMIGYFRSDVVQEYPLPGMSLFYPRNADFLGVVGNPRSIWHVHKLKNKIKKHSSMSVRSLVAPEWIGGINHSDNYSFWKHGFKAAMVTDTAFFRYKKYHQETDTIDTLNFDSMTEVVKGLYYSLKEF